MCYDHGKKNRNLHIVLFLGYFGFHNPKNIKYVSDYIFRTWIKLEKRRARENDVG